MQKHMNTHSSHMRGHIDDHLPQTYIGIQLKEFIYLLLVIEIFNNIYFRHNIVCSIAIVESLGKIVLALIHILY